MKNEKKLIIRTALLCLIPMFIGLALWRRLPDSIPTHFGLDGTPNGWSSKPAAVFGLPLFMLAMHLLCVFAAAYDPKNRNLSRRINVLILWIAPLTSLLVLGSVYASALGAEIDMGRSVMCFIGVLFVIVGNYLPKCRQNYTVGIKLPWTLADEDNWNRTHRLAGVLWIAGGLMILAAGLLGRGSLSYVLFVAAIVLMTAVPTAYSFTLYRRKSRD